MGCCHYYAPTAGGDTAFSVDVSAITFGPGVLAEAGDHVAARGIKRVALMTDKVMAGLDEHLASVRASLEAAGLDVVLYDEVRVEPTDTSFLAATEFARDCGAEAFVSLGGGSVMDTCKAANLYASYPAEFPTYVNAPIGGGQPVPGGTRPGHVGGDTGRHRVWKRRRARAPRHVLRGCRIGPGFPSGGLSGPRRDRGPRHVGHGQRALGVPLHRRRLSGAAPGRGRLAGCGNRRGAGTADAAEVLSGRLIALMRAAAMPNGIAGVGYGEADIPALTEGAYPQRRLLDNAPCAIGRDQLGELFRDALSYW